MQIDKIRDFINELMPPFSDSQLLRLPTIQNLAPDNIHDRKLCYGTYSCTQAGSRAVAQGRAAVDLPRLLLRRIFIQGSNEENGCYMHYIPTCALVPAVLKLDMSSLDV